MSEDRRSRSRSRSPDGGGGHHGDNEEDHHHNNSHHGGGGGGGGEYDNGGNDGGGGGGGGENGEEEVKLYVGNLDYSKLFYIACPLLSFTLIIVGVIFCQCVCFSKKLPSHPYL